MIEAMKKGPERPLVGYRVLDQKTEKYGEYVWESYRDIYERATNFGSGMLFLTEHVLNYKKPNQLSFGIWAINRPEVCIHRCWY